jgi:hypothetical protein
MRFIDPDGMGDEDKIKKEKPKEEPKTTTTTDQIKDIPKPKLETSARRDVTGRTEIKDKPNIAPKPEAKPEEPTIKAAPTNYEKFVQTATDPWSKESIKNDVVLQATALVVAVPMVASITEDAAIYVAAKPILSIPVSVAAGAFIGYKNPSAESPAMLNPAMELGNQVGSAVSNFQSIMLIQSNDKPK